MPQVSADVITDSKQISGKILEFSGSNEIIIIEGRYASKIEKLAFESIKSAYPQLSDLNSIKETEMPEGILDKENTTIYLIGGSNQNAITKELLSRTDITKEEETISIGVITFITTDDLKKYIVISDKAGYTNLPRIGIEKSPLNKYMPEGILYLNPDLLIQQVNPSAEQILGYAEQEVINRHIDDVIIGTDRLTPALQDALDNIPAHDLGHLEIHHRDGSVFPAIIKTFPVSKPDSEEIQGILIFVQDISKEEKVRIQTQQLERRALVGQMNAIFAHEIRNPINNITSGIQLLDKILPEDFNQRDVLKGINDDCDRLTHIVDTVLTFSKSQSYHRTPLDLPLLISQILNRWVPRMKRTSVSHVLKVEDNLPPILGDERALGQVFNNLISNAVRAMEETDGGVLSVRLKPIQKASGSPGVQIDVLDTGPGIPQEVQEHIFEPFFTTKPDGTGLGLSITKQIITMHEGTITLVPLPEGTSFQIILPGTSQEEQKE